MLTKRVLIRIKNKLKQACTHSKNVKPKVGTIISNTVSLNYTHCI